MKHSTSRSFIALVTGFLSLILIAGSANPAFGAPRVKEQAPARTSANFEGWVTREVHHELVTLPFYSVFDNLQYRVEGDRVVLMGQVVQPSLKSDAGNAVKSIEGVTAVDNQIEVLPT